MIKFNLIIIRRLIIITNKYFDLILMSIQLLFNLLYVFNIIIK